MPAPDRSLVVPFIERYFYPEGTEYKRGTIGLEHIIKDWGGPGPNSGTTCGYLPHWLWWRMGCLEGKLMCRYEPDTPFRYSAGYQINRVYAHPSFVKLGAGRKTANDDKFVEGSIFPKRGDAIIIQGPPDKYGHDTSHIFLALDEGDWTSDTKGRWRVAETGQIDNGGHISHHNVEYLNGKWMVGQKWMLGWLDLDTNIPFGAPREKTQDYLSRFSKSAVGADAKNLIGIWKVTDSRDKIYFYFFYKGFRVFYSEKATPTMLREGGYWIPQIGVTIHWDSGNEEHMTLSTKTAATGSDRNGPWKATKVTSNAVIMATYNNNSGQKF